MLKKTLFKNIVPIFLLVFPLSVLSKSKEAIDELTHLLQDTHTFSADFEQNIKDKKGALVSESSGKVKISRPGKFYWKIEHPEPVLVVADGKVLWHYDIELEQVTKKDLNKALANSPAALLAGSTDALRHNFKAKYAEIKSCKIDNDTCILLTSTEQDPLFNEIKIAFKNKKLIAMEMTDPLGQIIWTQYNTVSLNGALDKNIFHFTPPKNTDVIHSNQ
jgi:outer membrane lipoprotein carrier protein